MHGTPRAPRVALAAACGGYAAGAALDWGGSRTWSLAMGDIGLSAAALLASLSCLRFAWTRADDRFRPFWTLFGVSAAMSGLGNAVWAWYELGLGRPVPHASLADAFFLLFAPPAVAGLLLLARRPATRSAWTCLVLDVWLVAGSLLTLAWSFALTEVTARHGGGTSTALALAYPLMDVALLSVVLAVHVRRDARTHRSVDTAVVALVLTVVCDALFITTALRGDYASGRLLDAGWFTASLLLALAPWVRPARPAAPAAGRERRALAALTPYLAAVVCTWGILHASLDGRVVDSVTLLTGGSVMFALVARQGVMLRENLALTAELARKESHFRSLVQGSSDVIMIASHTGALRYVSPAAQGVYGRDPAHLVGTEIAALMHPEDLGRVLHEVRRFLAAAPEDEPSARIECRFLHAAGRWLDVESTVSRYEGGLILNCRDVTERVLLQAQLQHNASHDPLTDLPNRALFTDRVRAALTGRRSADGSAAVLFIDLDDFKAVNDTDGHQAGDELLVLAAQRLREAVRPQDTVARLGGDEFAALIVCDPAGHAGHPAHASRSGHPGYAVNEARPGAESPAAARERQVREIAERLRHTLSAPYTVAGGREVRVGASVGIAFLEPGLAASALLRHADLAMYQAKRAGKGRIQVHRPALPPAREAFRPPVPAVVRQRRTADDEQLAAETAKAFALVHQPVVDLADGTVTALSARPRIEPEPPVPTGPSARRQALTDRMLLHGAVARAAERHRAGHGRPVLVRTSTQRLAEGALTAGGLAALLARHELPGTCLVLELVDGDTRLRMGELARRIAEVRALGVRVALDGVGSGHAALAALRELPVDTLTLDRPLVEGLLTSPRRRRVAAGLLHIASELGKESVADGVESPEQLAVLRAMGCTHGQGALFAGPLEDGELAEALGRGVFPLPQPGASREAGPRVPDAADRGTGRQVALAGGRPPRPLGLPHRETTVPPT